jgi:hypothetical protein
MVLRYALALPAEQSVPPKEQSNRTQSMQKHRAGVIELSFGCNNTQLNNLPDLL